MVPAKNRSRLPSAASTRADCCRLKRDSANAVGQLTLQRELETAAQFRGGLAREGDRGHVLDLILAGRDAGRHPRRHHVRLAGTGARLDEQVAIELRHDGGA